MTARFWSSLLLITALLFGLITVPLSQSARSQAIPGQQAVTTSASASAAPPPETGELQIDHDPASFFVIAYNQGETTCREATPAEATELLQRDPDFPLHIITPPDLTTQYEAQSLQTEPRLRIILRGTEQLENFPEAKAAFIRAAARWESLIQNPITVILDVDYGPTRFGQAYGSGILGSTGSQTLLNSTGYANLRSRLIAGASSQPETDLYNLLPTTNVPTDIGETSARSGTSANLRSLGLLAAAPDPVAESNLGAFPSIGFNSAFQFDFDPSDGIDSGKTDFDAVVVHEIGHALGFVSRVGARELTPTTTLSVSVWDVFRFRPGTTLTTFQSASRVLSSGGDQVFYDGLTEQAVSTGRPNGQEGDGRQASHWKDDSFGGHYIGIMDPTLSSGRRQVISEGDLRMLDLIGYRLATNAQSGTSAELKLDDGTAEVAGTETGAIVLNRLTPAQYPAALRKVSLFLRGNGQQNPTGTRLRVLVYPGAGSIAAGTRPILDQTINLPDLGANGRFVDLNLPLGPVINAGDFFVGYQSSTSVGIAGDSSSSQQQRSFISTDTNGTSFQPLTTIPGTTMAANLLTRAMVNYIGCTFPINPVSQAFSRDGGNGTLNVTAAAGCSWTAISHDPWLTTTSTGSGNGMVSYTVSPNTETFTRTGYISVGDQLFSVTQAPSPVLATMVQQDSIPAAPVTDECVLGATQYQVQVTSNITQFKVEVDGGAQDVDLYVRFNQPVTGSPPANFQADFSSNGPGGRELVKVSALTTPKLQVGTYHVAVTNCSTTKADITVTTTFVGTPLPGPPTLIRFSPNRGKFGSFISIIGTNLEQVISVVFAGGRPGENMTKVSSNQITVKVPRGARSGRVRLVAPGHVVDSNTSFRVLR